jgi:hypothetical protein
MGECGLAYVWLLSAFAEKQQIVGVAYKTVSTPFQFMIAFIQHDVPK